MRINRVAGAGGMQIYIINFEIIDIMAQFNHFNLRLLSPDFDFPIPAQPASGLPAETRACVVYVFSPYLRLIFSCEPSLVEYLLT